MPKPAFLAGAGAVFWSVSGSYSAANMLFLRDPKIILTWIFFSRRTRGMRRSRRSRGRSKRRSRGRRRSKRRSRNLSELEPKISKMGGRLRQP